MENKEFNSQINLKLIILEIFPSLQELDNNNSDIITITFQDDENNLDNLYNLEDLLVNKKELDLYFDSNTSNIKIILNKNDILYASGSMALKNCEQWITLSYENKNKQSKSNLTSSLLDCIKIKIQCKFISNNDSINKLESSFKKLKKISKPLLNSKKKVSQKKFNINNLIEASLSFDVNKKLNRFTEEIINTEPHTSINKNNLKKIELSANKSNKMYYKKINSNNFSSLKKENLKNLSLSIPLKSKKSGKREVEEERDFLVTEIKAKKNRRNKTEGDFYFSFNSKNRSSIVGKEETSKSKKKIRKRKSDSINQVNPIDKIFDSNSKNNIPKKSKIEKLNKTDEKSISKKKSANTIQNSNENWNEIISKSSRTNNENEKEKKLLFQEKSNNEKLVNMINKLKKNKNNNNNNIDNEEIMSNHDIDNMENEVNICNINILDDDDDEDLQNDIFIKKLEDFQLLYSDEYLKGISDEYIKLEIELFIEKAFELTSLYNNQIEEKNMEYQIEKNNYHKNIYLYLEMQKLINKLRFIKMYCQLKKDNIKEIKTSHFNYSINNLITNNKQVGIFKTYLYDEAQKKKKLKKEMLKRIIKKLLEKAKNKKIFEKNEKIKNWIKNNCFKKDIKKRENNLKSQKLGSKKIFPSTNSYNINEPMNKKYYKTQTKPWKNKSNKKINEDKGKNRNKK